MRHRPEQCQTPRRRRGRLALPPGRLPVCGRNADLHTPPVSCSGYRSRCLGCMQTSVGAARRRRLAPSAQETNEANRRRIGRRTRPDSGRGRRGDEHPTTADPPQAGRWRRCNQINEASHQTPVGAAHAPKRFAVVSPSRRGALRKSKGARGERKTRQRLSFLRTARLDNALRAQVKHKKASHNTKKAHCTAKSELPPQVLR